MSRHSGPLLRSILRLLSPWLLVLLLAAGAVALIAWIGLHGGLSEGSVGALLGALIGAAAILGGVLIDRGQGRAEAARAAAERREKLKSLITAELVSVAGGLFEAADFVGTVIRSPHARVSSEGLVDYVTRPVPFTSGLGAELLALSPQEIDLISMLRSGLSQTETLMLKEKNPSATVPMPLLYAIATGIHRDMRLLADVFEAFAPERTLVLDGGMPEPASTLLHRLGATEPPRAVPPSRLT